MTNIILRRRSLGKGSCEKISQFLYENHDKRLIVVRNDNLDDINYDVCIRWGTTSNVNANIIINFARGIHTTSNKKDFRQLLQENNISTPKTFFNREDINIFPIIGRESTHSQGRNIIISNNRDELENDLSSAYWSEIIDKEKEFRVYIFFNRVILVAEKVPTEKGKDEIAWNRALGNSSFINVRWDDWNLICCLEALKAHQLSGLDFSGVDVMIKNSTPYILEINSAPSLTSEYRQQIFAKSFNWMFDIIENTGNKPNHFNIPQEINGYRDVILPIILTNIH